MNDQILDNGQGQTGADGEGGQTSFLDGIKSEELKGHEAIKGFSDLDSLAQDYVNIKANQPPALPENTEAYVYDAPEGIEYNQEAGNAFKQFALESKLTPDQYKGIMDFQTKIIQQGIEQINKQGEEAVARRRTDLGAKYDAAVENTHKAMAAFGAEDLINDPSFANDDRVFNMLSKIGAALSEGKLNSGGTTIRQEPKKGEDGRPMLHFPSMEKK